MLDTTDMVRKNPILDLIEIVLKKMYPNKHIKKNIPINPNSKVTL